MTSKQAHPDSALSNAMAHFGTQQSLADALGVTQQAVGKWLRAGWLPTKQARIVSKMTNTPLDSLINPRHRQGDVSAPKKAVTSNFQMKTTEVSIEMDGLHVTIVTKPDAGSEAAPDEAQIGDFHMSLFTLDEWRELSALIEAAIKEVTK